MGLGFYRIAASVESSVGHTAAVGLAAHEAAAAGSRDS